MKNLITFILFFTFSASLVFSQDTEPNNESAQASTITINNQFDGALTNSTDDVDWFKFTITYDGKIEFECTPAAGFDVKLNLYDQDGSSELNASISDAGAGGKDLISFPNLKIGTYFCVLPAIPAMVLIR